jgi:serine protease DegQ
MRIRLLAAALAALCLVPPLWGDEAKKPDARTYEVPYRMTNFNHVMVRAKINGKGPFNFIVDTGAPALFVSTAAARQAGVEPDGKGWGTFDRFEIEGGVVLEKQKGRIEDPFQLEGMNGMGLAGVELHGMIGYTVLAKYRIEFDFTRNKKPALEVQPRAFLGAELAEDGKRVTVKSVLPGGPAAAGGLAAGDRVTEFQGRTVREADDVNRYLGHLRPGQTAEVTVERGGETKELTIKVGEGF